MRTAECHPGRKHFAKGLCESCYQVQYRKQKGYPENRQRATCHPDQPHVARGLCRPCLSKVIHVENRYGIAFTDYQARFIAQDGQCAICGTKENLGLPNVKRFLARDHDHNNGDQRGLLCRGCNMGLGYFKDDPVILAKAAEYLRAHGS
jgi:hypothetical protein